MLPRSCKSTSPTPTSLTARSTTAVSTSASRRSIRCGRTCTTRWACERPWRVGMPSPCCPACDPDARINALSRFTIGRTLCEGGRRLGAGSLLGPPSTRSRSRARACPVELLGRVWFGSRRWTTRQITPLVRSAIGELSDGLSWLKRARASVRTTVPHDGSMLSLVHVLTANVPTRARGHAQVHAPHQLFGEQKVGEVCRQHQRHEGR